MLVALVTPQLELPLKVNELDADAVVVDQPTQDVLGRLSIDHPAGDLDFVVFVRRRYHVWDLGLFDGRVDVALTVVDLSSKF